MQNNVVIKLTAEEAVAVANIIGSVPTSQGVYMLWAKVKQQVENAVNTANASVRMEAPKQ
jgi:hypothetical protein